MSKMSKRGSLLLAVSTPAHVLRCDVCDRQFNSKKLFELHSRVVHSENVKVIDGSEIECDICHVVFPDRKALLKHGKKVHFNKYL